MPGVSWFSSLERASTVVAGASLLSRSSILVVLFAANLALGSTSLDSFVFSMGVVTATQVLVDPSALANFYLASHHHFDALRSHGFFSIARLQAGLSVLVVIVPVTVAMVAGLSAQWLALTAALGAVAFGENALRFKRVSSQDREEFSRFAGVDLAIGLVRCATAAVLLLLGLEAFMAFCVLAGLAEFMFGAPRRPPGFRIHKSLELTALIKEAWPYSGAAAFSSIYSQGPVILLGVFGSVSSAATYAIAARFTQPLELLPSAIANVHLPRLVRHKASAEFARTLRRQVLLATVTGVPIAAALWLIGPVLLDAFGFGAASAVSTLELLAIALIFKFISYQLVAGAISRGRIRERMKISGAIALASVVGVTLVASRGAEQAAVVTLSCEVSLCVALLILHGRDTAPNQFAIEHGRERKAEGT